MLFRLLALLAVAASLFVIAAPPGAIAQGSEKKASEKKQRPTKGPDAVPGNYRQLITRYLASKDMGSAGALSAQISRPGLWVSPIGLVSPAPIICVKWTYPGTFGRGEAMLIFRFHEGQIYEALNPESVRYASGVFGVSLLKSVTCDKLAYGPYPEIVKRQRAKR